MCNCNCCDCTDCNKRIYDASNIGTLPPAPAFAPSFDDLRTAMHKVFDQYPNTNMARPALTMCMLYELNATPAQIRKGEEIILDFLNSQEAAGVTLTTKGPRGGVKRLLSLTESAGPKYETKKTIEGLVRYVGETIKAEPAKPINNHTCPHCNNTECSKGERSCWKCGGSL